MNVLEPAVFIVEPLQKSGVLTTAEYDYVVASAAKGDVSFDRPDNERRYRTLEPAVVVVVEVYTFPGEAQGTYGGKKELLIKLSRPTHPADHVVYIDG